MTEYDPKIVQQFVDHLYRKAKGIILSYAIFGVLVGGAVGFFFAQPKRIDTSTGSTIPMIFAIIGAFVGGALGQNFGSTKAFHLKLAAQTALCQKQIEENTRRAANAQQKDSGRLAA